MTETTEASGSVDARVADLRSRAATDANDAAEAAWAWFLELKAAGTAAEAELDALYACGDVPEELDGPTDGILITTTTNPVLDPAVKAITALWMPWQGKRFDAATQMGDNRMTSSSSVVSKLLWPLYSMKDAAQGKLAFDFKTYVEAGKDDPDLQVLVIDYSDVESNPALLIRSIRDELVQIVPGAFLGKILYKHRGDRYEKIGFFALRS